MKEILYSLDKFLEVAKDFSLIRLSFRHRWTKGVLLTTQPYLFYPAEDHVVVWEGPARTFLCTETAEVEEYEKEFVNKIKQKIGFEPIRGRWE